jgi:hypothetical protein
LEPKASAENCSRNRRLGRTQVTDAGLIHLRGLTKLRERDLNATNVTGEGARKLRETLPDCIIGNLPSRLDHFPVE